MLNSNAVIAKTLAVLHIYTHTGVPIENNNTECKSKKI